MKLFAITAGRKNGNSEIVAKEVLMAAQALGAEIKMINLHDFKIMPCTGCEACTMKMARGGAPECIHKDKDDMEAIMKVVLETDGILVAVPSFMLQPAGIYSVFINRFLPYEVAFLLEARVIEKAPQRVAGVIAVGGSRQTWQAMSLAALHVSMFTQSIKVVDHILVTNSPRPGQVLLHEEILERAQSMGRNLVKAMSTPFADVEWLGEKDGWCPVCHNNLLLKGKERWDGEIYPVECAMCGAGGSIVIDNGEAVFHVDQRSLRTYRLESQTRVDHLHEIQHNFKNFFANKDKVDARIGKYKEFQVPGL
jgi:multimeric flavodoxin WrbA